MLLLLSLAKLFRYKIGHLELQKGLDIILGTDTNDFIGCFFFYFAKGLAVERC